MQVATVLVCGLIASALKLAIRRKRPCQQANRLYLPLDAHSFPSGHATRVAALAVVIGKMWPPLLILLLAWAVLVGLMRVVLGIHYLSDVLAGLSIELALGALLNV